METFKSDVVRKEMKQYLWCEDSVKPKCSEWFQLYMVLLTFRPLPVQWSREKKKFWDGCNHDMDSALPIYTERQQFMHISGYIIFAGDEAFCK